MLIPARPIFGLLATLGYAAIVTSTWPNLSVDRPIPNQSTGEVLAGVLALVGLRGRFSEAWCWVSTSMLLSLLSGATALDHSRATSIPQVMVGFLTASALYVAGWLPGHWSHP